MKLRKNLTKVLFLSIFMLTMVFASNNVGAAPEPELISSQLSYEAGTLLKAKGSNAVYHLGSDNALYVYPGSKTFFTWHDDFSQVKEVDVSVLDRYSAGGTVTVQSGGKIITHPNTAKAYFIGKDGEAIHIPNEATARKFFGNEWYKLLIDVDPGIFAISYKVSKKTLTEENIPDGSLVQEDSGDYFLIENGQKRKVSTSAFGINGLHRKNVLKVKRLLSKYNNGDDVDVEEEDISIFDPGTDDNKIVICHKPTVANARDGRTIKVSSRALPAHLAHGDTRGACLSDDDGDEDNDEVSCDNPVITSGIPLRIKYWQDLGLDTSTHPEIYKYQIQWFSGYWSPWYTPGVNDVDWKLSNRRVWSYFEDHNYRIKKCLGDDESGLSDLAITNILVEPSNPVLNEEVVVKVEVKNTGSTTLLDNTGILNHIGDFDGLWQSEEILPNVSETSPLLEGEKIYYYFYGKWDPAGEKTLTFKIDGLNELEESDETNNTYTEYVTVVEDDVLLTVCDHNGDGIRNLTDVVMFAECSTTFDANGDGIHNLTDIALYGTNNQDDAWCASDFVCTPPVLQTSSLGTNTLAICDHNGDGIRNLTDIAMFAGCVETFDANGDGIHNLVDLALYASYNQDDAWCADKFVCVPGEVEVETQSVTVDTLPICDHNGDELRNLTDIAIFAGCVDTFDANGDGLHDLSDLALYASYNQSNDWCEVDFVCNP
jgi:hypothetical protein